MDHGSHSKAQFGGDRGTVVSRNRLARFVISLLLLALASSCASSSRLWRMSPLINDATRDRVSLWPIVYHSGPGTAVLWPLMDFDDKGFALRPLVAKDGPDWELLYPWASYNTRTGDGWAVPFYSFGRNSGLFPIANFGRFSYVGPFWWLRNSAGEITKGGLFPIASFGDTSFVGLAYRGQENIGVFPVANFGKFSYVGPFWWLRDDAGSVTRSGLFPIAGFGETSYVGLAYWNERHKGLFPLMHFGEFNHVGSAWWSSNSNAFGLFPLFGLGSVRHVGPVWWEKRENGRGSAGLFPLMWFDESGDDFVLLPFYWHSLRAESRSRTYLLGLAHTSASPEGRTNWILPLYFDRASRGKADTGLLPFFWKHTRGGRSEVFTLLGNRSVDPKSRSLNIYPLWWSNDTETESWKMLLPFFHYRKHGDERSLITPLGGRGWNTAGDSRQFNVLGPLYHSSRSKDGSESRTTFLWPLFERHRDGSETTTRAAPFFSMTSEAGNARGWYALGLGHFQETPQGSSHRLWPLYSASDESASPGLLYDLTLYGSRSHRDSTERHLFPLYSTHLSSVSTDVTYLLGLGSYSKNGAETSWRLWPLVSRSESESDSSFVHWTSLVGSSSFGNKSSWHIAGPLVYSSRTEEEDAVRTRNRRWLTLFTDEKLDATGILRPIGTRASRDTLVHRSEQAFLFGAFKRERLEYRVWRTGAVTDEEDRVLSAFASRYDSVPQMPRDVARAKEILAAHGRESAAVDTADLQRDIAAFTDAHSERNERRKFRLPLLFHREVDGAKSQWNGPLWLISSKTEPEHSKFSLLYYGFRSETKGEETRRDIFPFITWDSSATGVNRSFMWRVFHYRSDGEKSGGHVLFIPWGDV